MKVEKIIRANLQFGNRESSPKNGENSNRKNKDEFEKNFKDYIIEPKDNDTKKETNTIIYTNTPQQIYEKMATKSADQAIEILQKKRQLEETRIQRKKNNLER